MNPSKAIEAFIKGYEQCRLDAYMPTPNDKPTIGWGSTGSDIRMGMRWIQSQADDRFARDLATFSASVERMVAGTDTTQGQFDAMVSLAYNIGIANFGTSSVLANHRHGHYATASLAFLLWNKQRNHKTGQLEVLNGLTKRRAAEAVIYRGNIA